MNDKQGILVIYKHHVAYTILLIKHLISMLTILKKALTITLMSCPSDGGVAMKCWN